MITDKEGQGLRNKSGTAFEQSTDTSLRGWINGWNLERFFELKRPKALDVGINGRKCRPDRVIESIGTGQVVLAIGFKASMKDRRHEDFWFAEGWKRLHPDTPWVQMTRCEELNLEKIKRKMGKMGVSEEELIEHECNAAKRESEGNWDLIASTMSPRMMAKLAVALEALLREALKQERRASRSARQLLEPCGQHPCQPLVKVL